MESTVDKEEAQGLKSACLRCQSGQVMLSSSHWVLAALITAQKACTNHWKGCIIDRFPRRDRNSLASNTVRSGEIFVPLLNFSCHVRQISAEEFSERKKKKISGSWSDSLLRLRNLIYGLGNQVRSETQTPGVADNREQPEKPRKVSVMITGTRDTMNVTKCIHIQRRGRERDPTKA